MGSGDWGPVLVAVVLFVLLTPGLLCQIPGNNGRAVEFRTMRTSPAAMVMHTGIFFWLCAIFMIGAEVHVYVSYLEPHQRRRVFPVAPACRYQHPEL